MAGVEAEAGWEAFVTVKNAFNEDYLPNITVVTGNSGLVVSTPGDDRPVNCTVRASFQPQTSRRRPAPGAARLSKDPAPCHRPPPAEP